MNVPAEGGCACGAVRYRLASEPMFVHCCHCLNCQRQTGSAFVINLLIESDRVELLVRRAAAGRRAARRHGDPQRIYRCADCQVAVYERVQDWPEILFVRGGTLDEPSSVEPDIHIFTRSKLPWVTLPEGVPAVEVYYDTHALWPAASLERLEAIGISGGKTASRESHDHARRPGEQQRRRRPRRSTNKRPAAAASTAYCHETERARERDRRADDCADRRGAGAVEEGERAGRRRS